MYKNILVVAVVATLAAVTLAEENGKCYALAMQGGGDKGAYQAGAFIGTVEALGEAQTRYQSISGVSVGGLNAGFISACKQGEERACAQGLADFWRDTSKDKVFKNWFGGIVQGIIFKSGIFDTSPLRKTIKNAVYGKKV